MCEQRVSGQRQLRIHLPGEAIAIPVDDALEHFAGAGATGPDFFILFFYDLKRRRRGSVSTK